MKMKGIIALILCAVCICSVFTACRSNNAEEETSAAGETYSQSSENNTESQPLTTEPQETASDTTKTETTRNSADVSFAKNGYWYLFDADKKVAYAFAFSGDSKVSLAYFDNANIEGEDAQYFTGDAAYSVKDNKLIIKDIPSAVGIKTIELTIGDNSLTYNGTALEKADELTLDIPFEHFNS